MLCYVATLLQNINLLSDMAHQHEAEQSIDLGLNCKCTVLIILSRDIEGSKSTS